MAKLATFYGIEMSMRPELNERHHRAHVHARYNEYTAVFDVLTREILVKGKKGFPNDQESMVKSWIAIHEKELMANWESLNSSGEYFKIAPLY